MTCGRVPRVAIRRVVSRPFRSGRNQARTAASGLVLAIFWSTSGPLEATATILRSCSFERSIATASEHILCLIANNTRITVCYLVPASNDGAGGPLTMNGQIAEVFHLKIVGPPPNRRPDLCSTDSVLDGDEWYRWSTAKPSLWFRSSWNRQITQKKAREFTKLFSSV